MTFTIEQQGLLKESVEKGMREKLEAPESLAETGNAGKAMVSEIYSPLVKSISDDYYIEVRFAD